MIGGPVATLRLRIQSLNGEVPDQICLLVAINLCQLCDIKVESDIKRLVLDIGGVLVAQIIKGDVLGIEKVIEFVRLFEAVLLK
jgi:hypothetical protein